MLLGLAGISSSITMKRRIATLSIATQSMDTYMTVDAGEKLSILLLEVMAHEKYSH